MTGTPSSTVSAGWPGSARMATDSGFATTCLGHFVAASKWDALPPALRQEAKRSLLNFVGCALGVANTPSIDIAVRVLTPLSGAEHVTVFGRTERLDPPGAAFINAIGGNLLDYDDTHLRTVIHPTAPVAPAALALAEQRGLTGADVLHAPRVWPEYHPNYFGAFVRDPDGNNVEAVCHSPE